MEITYVMINCEACSESSIMDKIKPIGCVKEIVGVFGNYDVLVKLQGTTIDEVKP